MTTETAAEFEAAYAKASGITVAQLHAYGRYAEPCGCGEAWCTAWAMGRQQEDAITEDALRGAPATAEQEGESDVQPGHHRAP